MLTFHQGSLKYKINNQDFFFIKKTSYRFPIFHYGTCNIQACTTAVPYRTVPTFLTADMLRHRVRMDASFSSVVLAVIVLEGLGRTLDPTLDLVAKAAPYLAGV